MNLVMNLKFISYEDIYNNLSQKSIGETYV